MRGPRFAPPGRLEAIADQLDLPDDRGRKALAVSRPGIAHVGASSDHTVRIARSLRSTVCGTHPSLAAISTLVYPSIFQRATVRSDSSGSRAEQPLTLLGHLRRQLGRRLRSEDRLRAHQVEIGEALDPPAPSRLPSLVVHQVDGLAHRQHEQQLPEIVAVFELRKLASLGPAIETLEGAERHVFLVGHATGDAPQADPRQPDEPAEVGFPEVLGRGAVSLFEHHDQARDGPVGRHGIRSCERRSRIDGRLGSLARPAADDFIRFFCSARRSSAP